MKKKTKPRPKAKSKRPKEDFSQAVFRAVQETARISESLESNKGR